jgi:hypothetical protein
MAVTQSIEGQAGSVWFHYDLAGDVLYLRRAAHRDAEAHGEETEDGFIVLRALDDDRIVGMTVVNWWKRFGQGALPDSLAHITASVEPFAQRAATAA